MDREHLLPWALVAGISAFILALCSPLIGAFAHALWGLLLWGWGWGW